MSKQDVIEEKRTLKAKEETGNDLLRPLIESSPTKAPKRVPSTDPSSIIIGELIGMINEGQTPLVTFTGNPVELAVPARSTTQLAMGDIGKEVALLFEDGDLDKPLIIGKIQNLKKDPPQELIKQTTVELDGETVVISAKKELVLKCGKSSITLTEAGKILIKGEYLSSRSTGVNRIKGGSIQLN